VKEIEISATSDIALARRNPLPCYEAADVSLDIRESHSSIFPAAETLPCLRGRESNAARG
jgi:hypothetical protein